MPLDGVPSYKSQKRNVRLLLLKKEEMGVCVRNKHKSMLCVQAGKHLYQTQTEILQTRKYKEHLVALPRICKCYPSVSNLLKQHRREENHNQNPDKNICTGTSASGPAPAPTAAA